MGSNETMNATMCSVSKPVGAKFQVVSFSFILVLSLIGNILVLVVVKLNRRMHSVANYLICNMSISDLIITLLPMTWEVVSLSHYPDGRWPMGAFMCSLTYLCVYISVASSILSLALISFDRFFAVLFPLKQIITRKSLPFLLFVIWTVSFAFASPAIYAQRLASYDNVTYCLEVWRPPFDLTESPKHYTIILFLCLYVAPLALMSVLYTMMALKLWRKNIPGNHTKQTDSQAMTRKKKVIKILICVVLVFAICWFPVFFAQFLSFFTPHYSQCPTAFPRWLQFFAFFMQYLGSAINPYIYFTFSNSFRTGFKHAIWWRVSRSNRSRRSTTQASFAMSVLSGRATRGQTVSPSMTNAPGAHDNNAHCTL